MPLAPAGLARGFQGERFIARKDEAYGARPCYEAAALGAIWGVVASGYRFARDVAVRAASDPVTSPRLALECPDAFRDDAAHGGGHCRNAARLPGPGARVVSVAHHGGYRSVDQRTAGRRGARSVVDDSARSSARTRKLGVELRHLGDSGCHFWRSRRSADATRPP